MIYENDQFFKLPMQQLIPHSENLKRLFFLNPTENLLQIAYWTFYFYPSFEFWKDFADALFFI